MRTSLNRIQIIDNYLLGKLPDAKALLMEAKMILDTELTSDVTQQQEAYRIIKLYGRKSLKAEIAAVQQKLNTLPEHKGFMQSIAMLFNKS